MKCIKATRESKYATLGDIKRVSNSDANEKVSTNYWKFIPKSEWKAQTRTTTTSVVTTEEPKKTK